MAGGGSTSSNNTKSKRARTGEKRGKGTKRSLKEMDSPTHDHEDQKDKEQESSSSPSPPPQQQEKTAKRRKLSASSQKKGTQQHKKQQDCDTDTTTQEQETGQVFQQVSISKRTRSKQKSKVGKNKKTGHMEAMSSSVLKRLRDNEQLHTGRKGEKWRQSRDPFYKLKVKLCFTNVENPLDQIRVKTKFSTSTRRLYDCVYREWKNFIRPRNENGDTFFLLLNHDGPSVLLPNDEQMCLRDYFSDASVETLQGLTHEDETQQVPVELIVQRERYGG